MNNKTFIVFLTIIPNNDLIIFAEKLSNHYPVFIIIDDNDYKITNNSKVNYIQLNDELCVNKGYQYCMEPYFKNVLWKINTLGRTTSYDKFFYYFTLINLEYDYIWTFEDDVFLPSVESLIKLNNKCLDNDLVCSRNNKNNMNDFRDDIWFSRYGITIFEAPIYSSMVCACRLSNKLMIIIKDLINKLKFIPYHEFLYNTVVYNYKLKILCPEELSTILHRNNWNITDFKEKSYNFFHPVKDFDNHEKYRNLLL